MTDELKPCLAHPCDGVMKPNMYDASLTCSACQFQVADEAEYSALVAGRQAAIDAALESVKQKIYDRGEISMKAGLPASAGFYAAIDIIEMAVGKTNPLAERDARIVELEGELRSADGLAKFNLNLFTEQARRIAELERELSEQADTIVDGLVKRRELERKLAEARKDRRRLAAMMPLFQEARDAICYIPLTTAKLRGLDLTLADRMDMVGIKEKWEEFDAALRQ